MGEERVFAGERLLDLLKKAAGASASDVFLVAGSAPLMKKDGKLIPLRDGDLYPDDSARLVTQAYRLAGREMDGFLQEGDDDFSFSVRGLGRFRASVYKQRNSQAAAFRLVPFGLPDPDLLGIPKEVLDLSHASSGLVVICGPSGNGKSTTLACIADRVRQSREGHIITIEDPVEFLYPHGKCIVSQREAFSDTKGYLQGLKSALRQAPDAVLIGEMRDAEVIRTAVEAAEAGTLVLSTMHGTGVAGSVSRILEALRGTGDADAVSQQLAVCLSAVVYERLLPKRDGGFVPAFGLLRMTPAVRTLVRERKVEQLASAVRSGGSEGMLSFDRNVLNLYRDGAITKEMAVLYAEDPDYMQEKMKA